MTVSAVGSAWNPLLIPRADGKWGSYAQGAIGSGAIVEAAGDSASGSGISGVLGSGSAIETGGDSAAGGNTAAITWAISASGLGSKGTLQVFEDFEAVTVKQYTAGQAIGPLTTYNGGPSVVNTKSASGSRSMYNDFALADFPEVYKPLSGANLRAYMACKLWMEGNGTVHVWKFFRIGGNALYGGVPHAGASYSGDFGPDGYSGEIVTSDGITSYAANNTAANTWAARFVKNQWLFYEGEFYAGTVGNSDAVFLERVNGVPTTIWNNRPFLTAANSTLPTWALTPFNGWDLATDTRGYIDEFYVDESRARVILTDNIVFTSSTKWEIQPIQTWNYNSGTGVTDVVATKRGGSSFVTGNACALHTWNDAGVLIKSESRTF